ncbi:maltose ABC transporter permease MalF [Haliangium sp.]|uniref:maltose ABC transporter permease MalF n=1 Tax=Haliangium sp. TaxID=2663208 RepID=UPI003D10B47C
MKRTVVLQRVAAALALLGALYLAYVMYLAGHVALAAACLGGIALAVYVYSSTRASVYRYLFPGLAGICIFVVFPLVYTLGLGFTKYQSGNFLTYEQATRRLLDETYEVAEGERYRGTLHRDGDGVRLILRAVQGAPTEPEADSGDAPEGSGDEDSIFADEGAEEGEGEPGEGEADSIFADEDAEEGADEGEPGEGEATGPTFVSERMTVDFTERTVVQVLPAEQVTDFRVGEPLPISALIERTEALRNLELRFPDGSWVVKEKTSLDLFLPQKRRYTQDADGVLSDQATGNTYRANFETGFYETADGEQLIPGFRVFVGFDNFVRILSDTRIQEPFLRIFVWTVMFAGLTVLFTLIVGMVLAELLGWEALRGRGAYRMLLFMPYAIPGFISILVFKGLFNPASGEINTILDLILGVRPDWFGDALLARITILIVNTWLGYPYIMLLCMGLQKSIPQDPYEASVLAGAGPLTNFFKITWPLIRKPLTPLLISSFAFNFNNFVLIFLLTGGRPDFLDTSTPAGETDILVSYTFRIAFQDSGTNYGLAAAISALIFIMVAILSIVNLRLTNVNKVERR